MQEILPSCIDKLVVGSYIQVETDVSPRCRGVPNSSAICACPAQTMLPGRLEEKPFQALKDVAFTSDHSHGIRTPVVKMGRANVSSELAVSLGECAWIGPDGPSVPASLP